MWKNHPKQQHYVPQLHLRQFACERGKNPRVYVFDKTTQKGFRTSVRNIAAEVYFYEKDDRGIEAALQRIEDLAAAPYRRLLTIDTPAAMTAEERVIMALYLAVQLIRTREYRAGVKSGVIELKKWLDKHGYQLDPAWTSMTEDDLRRVQLYALPKRSTEIAQVMEQMKWILVVNETPMPFWTSDHPICFYNPVEAGLLGNLGLLCRGIQVFFPLSPLRALCLCDPVTYADRPARVVTRDINHVWFQNDLQVRHSTRFLISNQADFSFARKVLDNAPEFADPDRQRVQIGFPDDDEPVTNSMAE